ncbi:DUF3019 domain-containing protein [Paraglaciecola arctica]|uniref:DUF3019 domain-containing protein n=1 Tax=Paraglaciecola arctica BSs20135 TaxID=493475 RepID=K6YVN0_9ALTE|nr:DUF3019 domain-containing protein [Paraglaciecola arctica]GAC20773.1 hypothetical protein GARC_3819 [Paraglaciecola arctica BSs20135]
MILTKKHKQRMPTLLCYFSLLLVVFTWATYSRSAEFNQNSNELLVTPERCVALRQGQTCYQEVVFSWRQSQKGNYCLINLLTKHILKCWQNTEQGTFNLDFQSTQSTDFVLRAEKQEIDLSKTQITVSWVFKSSKRPKSSWKLF